MGEVVAAHRIGDGNILAACKLDDQDQDPSTSTHTRHRTLSHQDLLVDGAYESRGPTEKISE